MLPKYKKIILLQCQIFKTKENKNFYGEYYILYQHPTNTKINFFHITLSQVQKIPNLAYQIYQTLQIYLVYEKDHIKYKYDRK